MDIAYIYTLSDPRTGEVRYVGKTTNLAKRLREHCSRESTSRTHRAKWVNSLLDAGVCPALTVVDTVDHDEWGEAERKWIAHFLSLGCSLVNATGGGEGAGLGNRNGVGNRGRSRVGWGNGLDACQECGTSERAHKSKGLCGPCYLRAYRAALDEDVRRRQVHGRTEPPGPRVRSEESNRLTSESLRRSYAEGRRTRGHTEETKRKISETKRRGRR